MTRSARLPMLAVLIGLMALPAQAQRRCDNGTFKGIYGLSVFGTIINLPNFPLSGPIGRIARSEADGAGRFLLDSFASYAGFPAAEPSDGTYTVNPDCSITIIANAPPPVSRPVTFRGTISEDGRYLNFLQWDPQGTTVKATAKQAKNLCSIHELVGNYSLELKGLVVPPAQIGPVSFGNQTLAGEYSQVGLIRMDPPYSCRPYCASFRGTVGANTIVSYAGVENEQSWSGTYTLNLDCSVNVRYSASTPAGNFDFEWWGVMVDDDREVRFIVTKPYLGPLVGTLTKQRP